MTAAVNGRVFSRGNSGSMYWTWPQLLAHASRDTTLRPGDVLGSGTVGTGCILELTPEAAGGWLKPGDVVELTIERLGTLRNRVVRPSLRRDRIAGETSMPPYLRLGSIPPQAAHRPPATSPGFKGEGIYYEEVVTLAGFSRAYSIVYHLRPPTRVIRARAGRDDAAGASAISPRSAIITSRRGPCLAPGDPITGRVPLLANDDVTLARCRPDAAPGGALPQRRRRRGRLRPLAAGARCTRMFGPLPFRDFDYIVIPRCTTYRLEFDAGSAARPARDRGGRQHRRSRRGT